MTNEKEKWEAAREPAFHGPFNLAKVVRVLTRFGGPWPRLPAMTALPFLHTRTSRLGGCTPSLAWMTAAAQQTPAHS